MSDQVILQDEDQFVVHQPREVVQVLNDLSKEKAIINVSFNRGNDQCLTTVIGTNIDKQAVYLDIGMDSGMNRRLLESHHTIFSKDDGIRVYWTSHKIELVKLKDGEALKIPLPERLIRIQRREFFRCITPVATPLICHVPYHSPLQPQDTGTLDLVLHDISLEGMGIIIDRLPAEIEVGTMFSDCQLHCPGFGDLNIALTVRSIQQMTLNNGTHKTRVGLQFTALSHDDARIIQRYVFHLERENLLRAKSE